jgi:hypothetical protein
MAQEKETVYVTITKDTATTKNKVNFDWKDLVFFQVDVSAPFVFNSHRGSYNRDNTIDKDWFVPNGLGAKMGVGIEAFEFVGASINTGIDWKINPKMVVVPVYGTARISLELPSDSKIILQSGYGKGIALGRGDLIGIYRKYSLGFEGENGLSLFGELSGYDFPSNPEHNFWSISLGISIKK